MLGWRRPVVDSRLECAVALPNGTAAGLLSISAASRLAVAVEIGEDDTVGPTWATDVFPRIMHGGLKCPIAHADEHTDIAAVEIGGDDVELAIAVEIASRVAAGAGVVKTAAENTPGAAEEDRHFHPVVGDREIGAVLVKITDGDGLRSQPTL